MIVVHMTLILEAQEFAREWVEAWNSHNIDRIFEYYSEDFEMTNSIIFHVINDQTSTPTAKRM